MKIKDPINVMYPEHGIVGNKLVNIMGMIVKIGNGPNGTFVTVDCGDGWIEKYRTLLVTKIVKKD